MSKRPQIPSVKQNQKLTDFFNRKPSGSSSSQPNSSQPKSFTPTSSAMPSKPKPVPRVKKPVNNRSSLPDRETIYISSDSHISISSDSVNVVSDASPRPMTRLRSAAPHVGVTTRSQDRKSCVASSGSLQLSQSPEIRCVGFSRRAKPSPADIPKNSQKRKNKFDSDSDVEILNTVVYVPKPVKPAITDAAAPVQPAPITPKEGSKLRNGKRLLKKPRRRSPERTAITVDGRVPSSQSDEELSLPEPLKKDMGIVADHVNKWRSEALSSSPPQLRDPSQDLNIDTAADPPSPTDPALSSPLRSPFSEADAFKPESVSTNPTSPCPTAPVVRGVSPATPIRLGDRPELPQTPLAMDAETKTAHIIAQIKAKAYADALSSPDDEHVPELRDLDNSSDEDEMNLPNWKSDAKLKSVPSGSRGPFSSPLSSLPSPYKSNDRSVLRTPSPYSRSVRMVTRSCTTANARPSDIMEGTKDEGKGKKPADAPFDKLLKEKKHFDKRMGAVRVSQNRTHTRSEVVAIIEQSERQEEDWGNEAVALANAQKGFELGFDSNSPPGSLTPSESDTVMKVEDQARLLGSERGEAITNLLASDREKAKLDAMTRIFGVPLWMENEGEEHRHDSIFLPKLRSLDCGKGHPVMNLLKLAVEHADIPQVRLLLDSGVLVAQLSHFPGVFRWLCELALSDYEHPLTESSFYLLLHFWNNGNHIEDGLSVPTILSILLQLGADPSVFAKMGWTVEPKIKVNAANAGKRAITICRLALLLTASARAGGVSSSDVPDILIILQLIALDPSTTFDLRRELMTAIDVVCGSLTRNVEIFPEMEVKTCNKLLSFAMHLALINQAFFVSFLAGGCPQTLRVARWLSYCLLVGENELCANEYANLPPLVGLIDVLCLESDGPFSIQNSTNYEDVGYLADMLSIALSDIDGYVAEERKAPQANASESGSKNNGKEKPLQLIRNHLTRVYSKIVDTRAAHLDRSKTKASLQRLSMRVYYQRLAALNSGEGKVRNLLNWVK